MLYKYSICYPNTENIEYKETPISGNEVLDIARNYPWMEQLKISESMDQDKVCYSPSLDFNCIDDGRSLGLTVILNNNNEMEFSLWYNRPKRVKILFGLLGEKEEMVVDDIWQFDLNTAIKYLEHFVNSDYQIIEDLY